MTPDKKTLELILFTLNEKHVEAAKCERISSEIHMDFHEYKYKGAKWAYQNMITMITQMIKSIDDETN